MPRWVSFALTSAPLSSSVLIASTLPVRAAIISGVRPSGSFSLASAPASSKPAMIAASPLMLASQSGVEPWRLAASDSRRRAPACRRALCRLIDRPVQCGRAVVLRRVDVGLLRNQLLHGGLVATHGRIGDVALARAPVVTATLTKAAHTAHANACTLRVGRSHSASSRPVLSPILSW